MLAERDVGVGPAVERRQIFIRHWSCKPEAIGQHLELQDERLDLRVIGRHPVVTPDKDEPVVAVNVPLVEFRKTDMVVDALVRDDAADKEDVDEAVAQY